MNNLKNFFEKLWAVIKPEAETAVEDFEKKITPDVYQLAEDAVTAAASLGGGAASRDAAFTTLKAQLVKTGEDAVTFADNEINALIELAYLAVKPTLPAPAAASTETEEPAPAAGEATDLPAEETA